MSDRSLRLHSRYSVLVLAAGFLFSLFTAARNVDEVFYSGDGGVKFLLTRQLARGDLHPDLRLPAAPWVSALWDQGFYPYRPPFMYASAGKRFINVPIYFSALTSVPYRWLGARGLYVVPTLALWLTWVMFVWACRRLDTPEPTLALGLFTLIFASPLTLYGALYWEHTLGVALGFGGLCALISSRSRGCTARLFAGLLLGLSVWFRSELFALVGVSLLLVLLARDRFRWLALFAGCAAAVGLLLGLNQVFYGDWRGMHAIQVLQTDASVLDRALNALEVYRRTGWKLLEFFPPLVPCIALAMFAARRGARTSPPDASLVARGGVLFCVLFPVTVALIVPSVKTGGDGGLQWGPRFLILMIPVLCLLGCVGWPLTAGWPRVWRRAALAVIAAAVGVGVFQNSWRGPGELDDHLAGRAIALRALRADPTQVVVFGTWWAAQEMSSLAADRPIFLALDDQELTRLARGLLANGVRRFLFVVPPPDSFDLAPVNGVGVRVAPGPPGPFLTVNSGSIIE
jgi:hypothetical protein